MKENTTKKRLFIAIPISENLQKKIINFQRNFPLGNPPQTGGCLPSGTTPLAGKTEQVPYLNVRWLFGKNLHITLIPPWYEKNIEKIKKILHKLENKIGQFSLTFEKICYGPNPFSPRVIWTEGKVTEKILILKKESELILLKEKIIANIEPRQFRLHVTLARFRPEDFKYFKLKKLNEKIFWEEKITHIVLMQSHLTKTHAEYEILDEIKL